MSSVKSDFLQRKKDARYHEKHEKFCENFDMVCLLCSKSCKPSLHLVLVNLGMILVVMLRRFGFGNMKETKEKNHDKLLAAGACILNKIEKLLPVYFQKFLKYTV